MTATNSLFRYINCYAPQHRVERVKARQGRRKHNHNEVRRHVRSRHPLTSGDVHEYRGYRVGLGLKRDGTADDARSGVFLWRYDAS